MVKVLTIPYIHRGFKATIHVTLLVFGSYVILIDGGPEYVYHQLEKAVTDVGFKMHHLTHLWLTHHDHDHMGIAARLKEDYPHIQVMCSKIERPYIEGALKSLRLQEAEKRGIDEAFINYLKTVRPVCIDETFESAKPLLRDMGVVVLNTPGHMPGHVSFYVVSDKTLIAGDAMILQKNMLKPPLERYCFDYQVALASLEQLKHYDISRVICYHGGVYYGEVGFDHV